MRKYLALALPALFAASAAAADTVQVAVAANFQGTLQMLAKRFEAEHKGVTISLSPGSSGKLYAQITNGGPFDVFFSADVERPEKLEKDGQAVAGSRFTYATGRLVLWSASPALAGHDCQAALKSGDFKHLAIANPETAPYGKAAQETLSALGLTEAVKDKLAIGESIAQAMQFTASRSADLGFVALAQMHEAEQSTVTCRWDVPSKFHHSIEQQAVLLKHGADNHAAADFLGFVKSDAARQLIRASGYDTGD